MLMVCWVTIFLHSNVIDELISVLLYVAAPDGQFALPTCLSSTTFTDNKDHWAGEYNWLISHWFEGL